ncbi:MAG: T9SS type A sorting domain-containing protein [Saprospiraceae bacterium]|nr:T9SS type A sorting domain-containing protein [Saprospiraceae bacterium]
MILLPGISKGQDTLICDNGGFESNFTYYFGKTATYTSGSDDCTPLSSGTPVTWSNSSLPTFRRFEIVTSGVDTLVGINRTKFGSKAALINNRYGHTDSICNGHFDANKLIKRFKVTNENREFTVWFAAILENPSLHTNSQPFFSIKCDRAPVNDLCFDASILSCEDNYADTLCEYSEIDAIDWTCHRIKIPKNMIDSIATLEIIAADCGCGLHFGYAYVDGICEECDGSAFGSAKLYDNHPPDGNGLGISYNGCLDTISFCGSYELPTVCGTWDLDSIKILNYSIYNLVIDDVNQQFCFDIPLSVFGDTCVELFAALYFSSVYNILDPVFTNAIEICPGEYEKYEVDVISGSCQDNNTSTLISDDYYYVQVDLSNLHGDTFTIERWLDDPYPNESGHYVIKADTGDGTFNLGPFFIQEGSWMLTIKFANCIDTFIITPPNFCSGCNKFYRTTISNITCDDNGSYSIADDTWTFDIKVLGMSGTFDITGIGTGYSYNTIYTIDVPGYIGPECVEFTLVGGVGCISTIRVCPPKPCSNNEDCELEVYLKEISCAEEGTVFYIELDSTSGSGPGYLCYECFAFGDPGNTGNDNYFQGSFANPFGPFNDDIYITVYKCSTSACDCDPSCFKVLYFSAPDCDNLDYRIEKKNNSSIKQLTELIIIPNPLSGREFLIRSKLKETIFELYNFSSKLIYSGNFSGPDYTVSIDLAAGLYLIRYTNSEGLNSYVPLIKL